MATVVALEPDGFVTSPVSAAVFATGKVPLTVDAPRFIVNPEPVAPLVSTPTDVRDEFITPAASVVPVNPLAEQVKFGVANAHPPPSVNVDGALPAPPPWTRRPDPSAALEDMSIELLKYGTPPDVTVPETAAGNARPAAPPVPRLTFEPLMRANNPPAVSQMSPLFGTEGATPMPTFSPAVTVVEGNRNNAPPSEPPMLLNGEKPSTSCFAAK